MNLQTVDSVWSTSSVPYNFKYIDEDEMIINKEEIENQYINFNNLGFNILNDIEEDMQIHILKDMLFFINDNYTSIINYENIFISDIEEIGKFTYQFFCVDCYNIILPKFLSVIKCNSIKGFESYITNNLNLGNSVKFKNVFISVIKLYLDKMIKLSKIDSKIKKDKEYIKMVKKFLYYIDLIEFGTTDNFRDNYVIPVVNKYFEELYWRSS